MRKKALALGLLIGLFLAGEAWPGSIKDYSADMVDTNSGAVVRKIYVTERKIRVDSLNPDGAIEGAVIMRLDLGMMYLLQEDQVCLEVPLDKDVKSLRDMEGRMMGGPKPEVRRKKLGEETVNGYAAEKFLVTFIITSGTERDELIYAEWLAPEFDFPVRLEGSEGAGGMEMRNVKPGTPDEAYFTSPAD